jgi:predicted DCC family thiol-disulfide oxidoreductase YuxK
MLQTGEAILLFDGVCTLCNRSVQFVLRHDKKKHFKFAPLQSTIAQQLLVNAAVQDNLSTVVLLYQNKVYTESSAVLKVLWLLPRGWKILYYLGILIPRFIRDALYRVVAKNRYTMFGQSSTCMVPDKQTQERFLA